MTTPPSSIASDIPPTLNLKGPYAFNPATDIPSLTGKVILITGANTGIGKQTALELARHSPAQIWVAARNAHSGEDAVVEINAVEPDVDVRCVELDLASFESVKQAAGKVVKGSSSAGRLDVLMLSAGMMGGHPGVTQEGYEKQFGTNHIGHALLLKLLTPLLLHTAEITGSPPRVISLSSAGHRNALPEGGISFETLKSSQLDISGVSKYTQSKLANVVYARQFAKHFPQLITIAIHPGEVATQLFNKGAEGGGPEIEYLAREIAPKVCVPVEEGVKNGLWAATALDVQSGRYYEPVGVLGRGSDLSRDEAFETKLWEWTQRELGGHEI
ncbi:NAD(P)-binding protein [Cucurbitaria berberidis CBS 394.84]|uniref:NAD(P)-binding protein n=1 Tax=Cucurbitaria berberidis CBS 394.84 TaxID=1168544 RepID=A0A9P4GQ28_9PLEO|nr:NAD(P)-binding protein [Cucurbitaria berberidis CBS 394.84]KAF1850543.1 NAD(P)-binding protein [Cucurbitaria berberidis CBS 394.84]